MRRGPGETGEDASVTPPADAKADVPQPAAIDRGAAVLEPGDAGAAAGALPRLQLLVGRFRNQITNLTAFTILQAASYLIPIVTIPYFARVLGISGMGQLAIAGAVALVAGVAMDYAIQLSGTRFAAANADDSGALTAYLDATILVKLAILAPILAALTLAGAVVPFVGLHFWTFFWSLMSAAMICLFPQWLFQGLLIMPLAARILVTCRVAAAAAAMLLVRTPDDVFLVPLAQAVGGVIALAATVRILRKRFAIRIGRPARGAARGLARENWTLFSATAWGAAYTHGGVIIMSTMLSTSAIGYYSIAQKISQAFVSMFNVAAQTGFPTFVRAHARAAASFGRQIKTYMTVVVVASTAALIIMFGLRRPIYHFFAGEQSDLGIKIFVVWLAASLFTITSVSLNPVMVVLRLDVSMARVYRWTGLTFLAGAPIACAYFGTLGMAGATLVTEGFMALFCSVCVIGGLRRMADSTAR